jgi:hypothetical protein
MPATGESFILITVQLEFIGEISKEDDVVDSAVKNVQFIE